MSPYSSTLREEARQIWDAAVSAAHPGELVRAALRDPDLPLRRTLEEAEQIFVVGAGKAGAAMAEACEEALGDLLGRAEGMVNVPAGSVRPLKKFCLLAARPDGSNHPTEKGVHATRNILQFLSYMGPKDVALCLLSGGGSALLPAPVDGISLEAKQEMTRLLHECGATINELNCIRKHLSAVKGGRLAQAFRGRALFSLIISDVVGDPLDVIASGPTAPDPTTFADALATLERYSLLLKTPPEILHHFREGLAGRVPETLKTLPPNVNNLVLGNNARSLRAAARKAGELGYPVLNLGSFIEGETRHVAAVLAGIVRSIRTDGQPVAPPLCLLSGGETTVTLTPGHGLGGRNQEFVLAMLQRLGEAGLRDVVVLSGGTDGEDGPTDAAGAIADATTLREAQRLGLAPASFLARNDAYHFFQTTGGLLLTGLTQTNVMDVRVVLMK